jgi:hypothetical protein
MRDLTHLLSDAAAEAPENDRRAEQVIARGHRRRRRSRVIAVAAALAIVAGGATAALTVGSARNEDTLRPIPPATASPGEVGRTSGPAPTGRRVTFGAMTITLPVGWDVVERRPIPAGSFFDGQAHPAGETMCVAPAGNRGPQTFGCAGLRFDRGAIVGSELKAFTAHQVAGWYFATDVQPCPVNGQPNGPDSLNGIRWGIPGRPDTAGPRTSGFLPVGDRTAYYDQWAAYCESGYTFTPESWYLPTSQYRIIDFIPHRETAAILRTIRFHFS